MKVRKGSINYWLLIGLEKGIIGLESLSYSAQYRAILGFPPHTRKSALAEGIRRLRKQGIIEYETNTDGKIMLKLTFLGKSFLGDQKPEEWDGIYRIVIWDIPEKKRRLRDLFRRRLKEWGFVHWQHSVWVSKRNVTGKLRSLISELGMDGMIVAIESDDPSLSLINFHDRE